MTPLLWLILLLIVALLLALAVVAAIADREVKNMVERALADDSQGEGQC